MQCEKCSYTGPEGEDHYHINVEHGVVTEVWFVSGNGYWDRELEKDEYFVEYTDTSIKTRFIKLLQAVKIPKPWNTGKPANDELIKPTLYTGYTPEPSLIAKKDGKQRQTAVSVVSLPYRRWARQA